MQAQTGSGALVSSVIPVVLSSLVSFVVAWLTARRALRLEEVKLRIAAETSILHKLTDVRLEAYPKLWALLNKLGWSIDSGRDQLEAIHHDIEAWDSQYAVILGPATVNRMYELRRAIRSLVFATEDGPTAASIFEHASALELALRSDVGIYGLSLKPGNQRLTHPNVSDYEAGERL